MSSHKTLISLLLATAILAVAITLCLPLLDLPTQFVSSGVFMVAMLLFKMFGAIAASVLLMLVVSDRPWRKLRHNEDVTFSRRSEHQGVKREPFNPAFHGHLPK